MSQENAEVVRQPMAVGTHTRRRLEERLGLRFPGPSRTRGPSRLAALAALPAATGVPSPCHSHWVRGGQPRRPRGGPHALPPEVESTFPAGFVTVGAESGTRGREERRRFQANWYAEWGGWRVEPKELIDLGDRVLVLGRIGGRGLQSGAAVDTPGAFLFTISAGQATREQVFFDHDEALKAAGLSE